MYVFQITRTEVEDGCRINGMTFENNPNFDYCSVVEGEDREIAIQYLCGGLPEGMFEREGDTLTYKGGYKENMDRWAERLTDAVKKMKETPMSGFNDLVHTTHYPTETMSQIYEDPYGEEDCTHDMGEWIAFSVPRFKEGDKLYIGGVVYEK